jgi:hypothetical protein
MRLQGTRGAMTHTKNVYALMLALVIVLSGCFGLGGGDAEAEEDDASSSDPATPDTSSASQALTWYASGAVFNTSWDDLNRTSNGLGCMSMSPHYDSSTGEYLGEECHEVNYALTTEDWNGTDCTDMGGELDPTWERNSYISSSFGPGAGFSLGGTTAPYCRVYFATISTTSGEVLSVYQMSGSLTLRTTCDGVTAASMVDANVAPREYVIAAGGAIDCHHTLYRDIPQNDDNDSQSIWSIVYAIQDVTVV